MSFSPRVLQELRAIHAYKCFFNPDSQTNEVRRRFHFYYDTNVVLSWMRGLPDFVNGEKEVSAFSDIKSSESALMAALLCNDAAQIDLLIPHLGEFANQLTNNNGSNSREALAKLIKSASGQLPQSMQLVHDGDQKTIRFKYDSQTPNMDIELFLKVALLARVDRRHHASRFKSEIAQNSSFRSEKVSVKDTLDDPLYLSAREQLERLRGSFNQGSLIIDAAAIVHLAKKIEQYNSSDACTDAPVLVVDTETTLSKVLVSLAESEEFRNRLTLKHPLSGHQIFGFHSPLLVLLESFPIVFEDPPHDQHVVDRIPFLGWEQSLSTPDGWLQNNKEKKQLSEYLERTKRVILLNWLRSSFPDVETDSGAEIRAIDVSYNSEELQQELNDLSNEIKTLHHAVANYAIRIAIKAELVQLINLLRDESKRGLEDLKLRIKLSDLKFGRPRDRSILVQIGAEERSPSQFITMLRDLVNNADVSLKKFLNNEETSEQDLSSVANLEVLLTVAISYATEPAERDALLAYMAQIMTELREKMRGTTWQLSVDQYIQHKYLEHSENADENDKLNWLGEISRLQLPLEKKFLECKDLFDRLRVGFPLANAYFYEAMSIVNTPPAAIDECLQESYCRHFIKFANGPTYDKGIDILRELYILLSESNIDMDYLALLGNQLLFALCSSGKLMDPETVSETHKIAGNLKRLKQAGSGWIWEFEHTRAVYCIRTAVELNLSGEYRSELVWLKKARAHLEDAVIRNPSSFELEDAASQVEVAISVCNARRRSGYTNDGEEF